MVRNLRQFVETYLVGSTIWEHASIAIPNEHAGDVVEASLDVSGRYHTVRVESPELSPMFPNGRVMLDAQEIGPIDDASWKLAAKLMIEGSHGRQPKPDGAIVRGLDRGRA